MSKVTKAIIPAAGRGRRYYLASGIQPKETMPVGYKPAIHYAIQELLDSGIREIAIVTSKDKSGIEDYLDISFVNLLWNSIEEERKQLTAPLGRSGTGISGSSLNELLREIEELKELLDLITNENLHIAFVRQKTLAGPANAVGEAAWLVKETPFCVLLVDDVCLYKNKERAIMRQLIDLYEEKEPRGGVVGLQRVRTSKVPHSIAKVKPLTDVTNSGIYEVISLQKCNEANYDEFETVGRYVLNPEFFEITARWSKETAELTMTEVLQKMVAKKLAVYGLEIDGERFDLGIPVEHIEAQVEWASRHLKREVQDDFRSFLAKKYPLKFLKETKARISHTCYNCRKEIKKGEIYYPESIGRVNAPGIKLRKFCKKCYEKQGEKLLAIE